MQTVTKGWTPIRRIVPMWPMGGVFVSFGNLKHPSRQQV